MARGQLDAVLQHLRKVFVAKNAEQFSDANLMERFALRRDDAAFTVLVRRHGGLVLNVCRRVLKREADAEDAFQAVFLVLARKAASLRKEVSLAGWLHGVAYRCAQDLRKSTMRRHKREQASHEIRSPESPLATAAFHELQSYLDEAIQQLSAKDRTAFVLCILEGKSRAEAAQTLGCTEAALASRLAKARQILQKKLTARGVTLSAALGAVAISPNATSAVPASLTIVTTNGALAFTAGSAAGVVSPPVLALAKGLLQSMLIAKLKVSAVLMMAVCLSISAAHGLIAQPGAADNVLVKAFSPNPAFQAARDEQESKIEKKPQTDAIGDPLPDGAVARLGARPFRHAGNARALVFSPDGKALIGYTDSGIVIWDTATGREKQRLIAPISWHFHGMAISPDGDTLAILQEESQKIGFWDLASGKQTRLVSLPPRFASMRLQNHLVKIQESVEIQMRFRPDGKRLSLSPVGIGDCGKQVIVDVTSGQVHESIVEARAFERYNITISPDGKSVAAAIGNRTDPHCVLLLDFATGKINRTIHDLPSWERENSVDAMSFSPDGKILAYSMKDTLVLTDLAADKKVIKLSANSWPIVRLAFTPDGKKLVSAGGKDSQNRVWDVATGTTLRSFGGRTESLFGASMALSPNGKTVAIGAPATAIDLWDVDTGKQLFAEHSGHGFQINDLVMSPNGQSIVSTEDLYSQIFLWDSATGKRRRVLQGNNASYSPNGELLATTFLDTAIRPYEWLTVRIWNVAESTEKLVMTVPNSSYATFSPDGKKLFTLSHKKLFNIEAMTKSKDHECFIQHWDLATGNQEYSWPIQLDSALSANSPVWPTRPEESLFALSPDGRALAVTLPHGGLRIHYAGLGAARSFGDQKTTYGQPFFSGDGRMLATGTDLPKCSVRIWEVATGKVIFLFKGHEGPRSEIYSGLPGQGYGMTRKRFFITKGHQVASALAWSPDGRLVATGNERGIFEPMESPSEKAVHLWDMASGKELASFRRLQEDVTALTFSADGGTLVVGLVDGSIITYEVGRFDPRLKPAPILGKDEMELCWNELAADDAGKAQQAAWMLADAPTQSTPFLRGRLKPTLAIDGGQIQEWIADLSSEKFSVRDAALKKLLSASCQSVQPVQKALTGELPLATRRRLKQVLDNLAEAPDMETVRTIRAIAVLERIGTPEAQVALEVMARGAPRAHATEEAAAALKRLTK